MPSFTDLYRRWLQPEQSPAARLSAMMRQDYARPEPPVPDYPPLRGFGYRIPIIPPRKSELMSAPPRTSTGAFGSDQIEQAANQFSELLRRQALQRVLNREAVRFDPLSGVQPMTGADVLAERPGSVLRQGPMHLSIRGKLGPLGQSNAGDVGVGDFVPGADYVLSLDDLAAMRAQENAGLDVGVGEKAGTFLGVLAPVPGVRRLSKAGGKLFDRIVRRLGQKPDASILGKLATEGIPAAENATEGTVAVERALSMKSYVPAAMYRPDLGEITITHGVAGDPAQSYQGGYGLSHIIERRKLLGEDGEAVVREIVPDVLANGRVIEQPQRKVGPPRIAVVDKGHKVFLEQRQVGG